LEGKKREKGLTSELGLWATFEIEPIVVKERANG
jgi:hypothetical protein